MIANNTYLERRPTDSVELIDGMVRTDLVGHIIGLPS
jgi:hypothetical protein